MASSIDFSEESEQNIYSSVQRVYKDKPAFPVWLGICPCCMKREVVDAKCVLSARFGARWSPRRRKVPEV